MKRVTGIGGIFFSAKDQQALRAWYQRHLGIDRFAQFASSGILCAHILAENASRQLLRHRTATFPDFAAAHVIRADVRQQIIEVKATEVALGSLCGGGRYDDLTSIFGLPGMSGVGISFGADRIYDGYPDVALEMISSRTFDGRSQLLEYVPRVLSGPPGIS